MLYLPADYLCVGSGRSQRPGVKKPCLFGPSVDFQLKLDSESVSLANPAQPVCADVNVSVRDVLRLMQANVTGAAILSENGQIAGILTERDILRILADDVTLDQPVSQVMAKDPVTLTADDTVGKAIELMSTGGFRRLPIVDNGGRISGTLKVSGILRYLVEHFPKVVYTLPPTPHYKPLDRDGA